MKTLVTGSNGFLGTALVQQLLIRGYGDIRCLVRPASNHSKLDVLAEQYAQSFEVCYGSLNSKADCERIVNGVDLVFHLAAGKGGAPSEMFLNASVATKNLLESIVNAGCQTRIVHCSSFGVYGAANLPAGTQINENTPIEPHPERRDLYSFSKHHQEEIVFDYIRSKGVPGAILRPGVIYGPGGVAMSSRVGLNLFGIFLHLGRNNMLPLTFVENCAEAFIVVGESGHFNGDVYNVVDDELITAKQFLTLYRNKVKKFPYVTLPYPLTLAVSLLCEKYFTFSKGQLPDIFTRYKSAVMWKGNRFSNAKLKELGWKPTVSTNNALNMHFTHLQSRTN